MFRVNNFSVKLGDKWIIRDLTFEIEDGSLCFLKGGQGKSILCLAFTGLLKVIYPEANIEGNIYLDGEEVGCSYYNPLIAITLENPYAQISGMKQTVINEIALGLELTGVSADTMLKRIYKAADDLFITNLLERDPRYLSGGETQKVAIACSYVMMPKLWILDRPFTELDESSRLRLIKIMIEYIQKGNIIIVTDDEKKELLEKISTHYLNINDDGTVTFKKNELSKLPQLETSLLAFSKLRLNLFSFSSLTQGFSQHLSKNITIKIKKFLKFDSFHDKKLLTRGLKFAYKNGPEIFNNFNFAISSGESVLITGPNGSGKTTLAKLIMGILKPDAGTIEFVERFNRIKLSELDIWEVSQYVSYAFQNPDLQIFSSSVYDEVSFSLKVRGYKKTEIEKRVKEVLKLFGLWDFKDTHPHNLRRSQKKLLGIAIAYVTDTPILILDEPFQYQDNNMRKTIIEAIKVKLKEGKIVLIITH
jgi:energy-coupling factor transporter ATP-binding protein EcfA2